MTEYRTTLGNAGIYTKIASGKAPLSKHFRLSEQTDYEKSRFGIPHGGLNHKELQPHIKRLISLFWKSGYKAEIPEDIPADLYRAVKYFRVVLDLYDEIAQHKCFSKDELYLRCLEEGPSFTEFIKKSRSTSYRYHTTETETDIDPQYVCEDYKGYDSIIHERNMIHWDDREDVDDIKYCFMPVEPVDTDFSRMFDEYLTYLKIDAETFYEFTAIDAMQGLQPTSMLDAKTSKTRLMREFWFKDIDMDEPYFGKRSTVLVAPGSTRDALVGTPSTVQKVKLINQLSRQISERCPHSANASGKLASDRYLRVLKRHLFMHLDFKKYGLTFPRQLTNIAIERICRRAGIDPSDLLINDFFVEIDDEIYRTERGSALGWFDPINALCVNAILFNLRNQTELKFDFIGFNDDFELSLWHTRDVPNTLNSFREILINEFNYWQIPLSADKIFGSRASVFLENYMYSSKYDLNMDKSQLCITGYAKSIVSTTQVEAKVNFAGSWRLYESEYARDRCMSTIEVEFDVHELVMPIRFGGWYDDTGLEELDESLLQTDRVYMTLGAELMKYQPPKYSARVKKVSSPRDIKETVYRKTASSKSSEFYRNVNADPGTLDEVNAEAPIALDMIEMIMQGYIGRDYDYSDAVMRYVSWRRACSGIPPAGTKPSEVGFVT
jgi:hypothetical protein